MDVLTFNEFQYSDSDEDEDEEKNASSNPFLNFSYMNLPNLSALTTETAKNSPRLTETLFPLDSSMD